MNANQSPVVWTMIICSIVLLVAGFVAVGSVKNAMPETPVFDIPTAAEVAALINIPVAPDMPDTRLSVKDYKKALSIDLATDELSDRDVKKAIATELENCDDVDDVDYKDITSIIVKDDDVSVGGTTGTVTLEVKVYFDNYGDEAESARMDLTFDVSGLDRDDDYEDAEAEFNSANSIKSCSTD